MINLLDNAPNHPSKFRTKNCVEINGKARGTYISKSQIKFEISVLKSRLYDYSIAQILTSGTITITEAAADKEKEYQLKVVRHLLIAWVK